MRAFDPTTRLPAPLRGSLRCAPHQLAERQGASPCTNSQVRPPITPRVARGRSSPSSETAELERCLAVPGARGMFNASMRPLVPSIRPLVHEVPGPRYSAGKISTIFAINSPPSNTSALHLP